MCIGTLFYFTYLSIFLFLFFRSCPKRFSFAELALSDNKTMFTLDDILWHKSFAAISLIITVRNF